MTDLELKRINEYIDKKVDLTYFHKNYDKYKDMKIGDVGKVDKLMIRDLFIVLSNLDYYILINNLDMLEPYYLINLVNEINTNSRTLDEFIHAYDTQEEMGLGTESSNV